ncbi:MAG: helix-turn-helix domain-containing protein [bacterium]
MNIAQVLKAEISRISKHEAKALSSPTRSATIILKKTVVDLKSRLSILEKSNKELQRQVASLIASQPKVEQPDEGRVWISGKGVKALRRKLGLTQDELARLTSVSKGAVVQWESKSGMLKLRDATKKAVMAVRGIGGKAEARKRLEVVKAVKGKKAVLKRRK